MDVDDGSASIELLHHGIEAGISEPAIAIARHEHDAVCMELIEGVFDLAQSAIDVRKRERGEEPESLGMNSVQSRSERPHSLQQGWPAERGESACVLS